MVHDDVFVPREGGSGGEADAWLEGALELKNRFSTLLALRPTHHSTLPRTGKPWCLRRSKMPIDGLLSGVHSIK